ncbi:MAG: hypothetical protein OXB84_08665, partial [Halobacteriovoraceae bacterium]|nr:hypothetical protein [Halobacteriovoraceae bacterium]
TVILAFSQRPLREIKACLTLFNNCHFIQKIFLTRMEHSKAWRDFAQLPFFSKVEVAAGWRSKFGDLKGDVLVTGSYYFIGEFKRFLIQKKSPVNIRH